jgi:hypothetical protein
VSPGDSSILAAPLIFALDAAENALVVNVLTSEIVVAKVTTHDTLLRSPLCTLSSSYYQQENLMSRGKIGGKGTGR